MAKEKPKYPRRRTRRFRRGATFVVVRPVRLTKDHTLQPGELITPGMLRRYHLMSLYRRFRIAEDGDLWAEGMIAGWKAKGGEVASPPEPEPELVAEAGDLKVFFVGSGWYSVRNPEGEEVEKLRGQEALESWVAANPTDPPTPNPEGTTG